MKNYIKVIDDTPKWNRPVSWCPRPDGWEDKKGVYWLVENNGLNIVYFQCDKKVKMYVNDVLEMVIAPNQGQTMLIELFEEDYVSIEHAGKNWIWIYFDVDENPTISTYTNNHLLVGNKTGSEIGGYKRYVSTYEEIINLDNVVSYYQNDPGAVYKISKTTQNVCFRKGCVVGVNTYLFSTLYALVNIENFPIISNWGGTHCFRGTTFNNHGVFDLKNTATTLHYFAYQGFALSSVKFINTSSLIIMNYGLNYCQSSYIEIEDCSNITSAIYILDSATYLRGFKLNNLGVSFIVYCGAMTEYSFIKSFGSLKDLTGLPTQNITLRAGSHLNNPNVLSVVANKNWTVSFI